MATDRPKILSFPQAAFENKQGRLLIPERITDARIAAGLTQSELAHRVGIQRQSVSYFERGDRNPDPNTMAAIAEALGQPLRYFSTPKAEMFGRRSANFFRKQGADTKRRNAASDQYAEWLAQTAHAFNDHVHFPEVKLPKFEPAGDGDDPNRYTPEELEEIAEQTRDYLGLGLGPIANTIRLLESNGVIVARHVMEGEKIGAFSFWSGTRPFIFLASDRSSAARARYDVCHELGHLVLHRWVTQDELEDKNTLKEIEREADYFAGAFLLPRKSFPNEIFSPRLDAFLDLKRRWKVSIQAMIYRCKNLGIFDEDQCVNLYKQVSYKKWRTVEPLDGPDGLPMEQPVMLTRVSELVLQNSRMKADELLQRLGFNQATVEQLIGLAPGALSTGHEPEPPIIMK